MAAAQYNFVIEQGATFTRSFTYKDSSGCVINLTGYTAHGQIRQAVTGGSVLLDFSTANGLVAITGSSGLITWTFPYTTTANITFQGAPYDFFLYSSGSTVVTKLLYGTSDTYLAVTRNG